MKRLMVIAGGTWQVPIIRKSKSLGLEVVNSNLYEDSPGFRFADYGEVADVRDKEKNLEIAKKYKIDGVITDQSDIAVPTVAYVAEQLKCPTIGSELAKLFTNKFEMKKFFEEQGFPVPEYQLCTSLADAQKFFTHIQKKSIIKPLDSQSSRGIYIIHALEDLEKYFEDSQLYSSDGKSVIIERYIEGTEFTVDGVVVNGVHYTLAISEKEHYEYNPNIANKLFFSYDNDKYDYDMLRKQHNEFVNATGLPFGITHAEYKYENGKYYLIEIAARGGGTKISSDIVPYLSGVDNYKILLKSVLGESIDDECLRNLNCLKSDRCAVLEFLDVDSNGKKIMDIQGIEDIKNLMYVKDFQLEFKIGDILKKADDDRSRVGYFIVCADSRKKVIDTSNKIKQLLKIRFEE